MRMRFLLACLALCGLSRVEAQTSCADGFLGLSESLNIGERNVFVGTVRKTATPLPACALPTLPAFPAPATTQLVVAWGATASLDTSFHGNVLVHSGSTLLVKPGAYRIGSLTQEWGSILRVDTTGLGKTGTRPGVQMVVMGAVQWMDGATTIYPGLTDSLAGSKIALYVSGGNPVVTGNGTSLRLQLTAPLSLVSFGDRTKLWGRVLSRSMVWHNDAVARFAANGVPPTWTTTTTVSIQGPRRFWTNASSVPVNWTVNGAVQTSQASEVLAAEGAHWIKRSSGAAADSVLAMVDRTAPVVQITLPVANFTTNKSKVAVSYTVDGVSKIDTATLVEGSNTITRTSTDSAGNTGTTSVLVTLDTQAPVIAILSPEDYSWTNKTRVAVTYTVDGVSKVDSSSLVEGSNTITRSATDAAGNVGSSSVVVKLDTKAPVVAIVSPDNNAWSKLSPVTLTYTVDGVQASELRSLTEGTNVLMVDVADSAGNRGSASVSVKLDTNDPVIAFISVAEGDTVRVSDLNVTWSADGDVRTDATSLSLGWNVVERHATDSAGNIGSKSIHVYRANSVVGNLVAIASAPSRAFPFTSIVVTSDSSTVPSGIVPAYSLRQIGGTAVRISPDGSAFQILTRDATNLVFELTLADSAGVLAPSLDTVTVQVSEPANLWEQIQAVLQGGQATEGLHSITITDPSKNGFASTSVDTISVYGVVELDSLSRTIELTNNGSDAGSFQAAASEWVAPSLVLTKGDNLVRVKYVDDSGKISVDQMLVTDWDSLQVTRFDVGPDRFPSGQMVMHQVRVQGQFAPGLQTLEVVQVVPDGERVLGTLSDLAIYPDSIAGDGIWSGSFAYQADSGEEIFLRVRGTYATGTYESGILDFLSLPAVTTADINRAMAINDSAASMFGALSASTALDTARSKVISWLRSRPDVQGARMAFDGWSIAWTHRSGVVATISDAPEGTMGSGVGTRIKAFGVGLKPDKDPMDAIYPVFQGWSASEPGWWNIDPNPDASEFRNDLRHWVDWEGAKAVVVSAHGGVWQYVGKEQVARASTVNNPQAHLKGTTLLSGDNYDVESLQADGGFLANKRGGAPKYVLSAGASGVSQVALTSEFFRSTYTSNLDGTLIFLGSCQSARTQDNYGRDLKYTIANEMRTTRLGGTRNAMVGFDNFTRSGVIQIVAQKLFGYLKNGITLAAAMDSIYLDREVNQSGTSGATRVANGHYLKWYDFDQAHGGSFSTSLRYYGDGSFTLTPSIKAAGRNGNGQLGDGTTTDARSLVSVQRSYRMSAVAASHAASAGLLENGKVLTWGSNVNNELGNNQPAGGNRLVPDSVMAVISGVTKPLPNIIALKGANFTNGADNLLSEGRFAALDAAGTVWAWGKNDLGQIGLPSSIVANRAKKIAFGGGLTATSIDLGGRHGIAVLSDKTVGTFGYGYSLGQGIESNGSAFVAREQGIGQVVRRNVDISTDDCPQFDNSTKLLRNVRYIGAGATISFAVTEDDSVFAWGNNYRNQAGMGTWPTKYCAWKVGDLCGRQLKEIHGGTNHTLGLDVNGRVLGWGMNSHGALGIGGVGGWLGQWGLAIVGPQKISIPTKVKKISAGDDISAALDETGTVYVWGRNDMGQLGLGHTRDVLVPTKLPGRYLDVVVGSAHILAIPK